MIKVVHFIHGLNTGGAETLVKDYISNFDRNKFDIALLCLGHEKDSPYEEELAKLGIKVIYIQDDLPFKSQNNFLKRAVNYFYRYWAVRTEILDESPDVLHTHLSINTFVKFSKPKKKTVIFHTVHNEPMILWRKNDKERLKDYGAAKWLVKHYGMRFIVLHDEMRKEVNRMLGVRNSVVLNNGINVEKFKNTKSKRQIREELKIPQNAFVVGHIGRFSEQKNHVFLVQVFTEILKKNKEVFLLIVGDGEDKSKIVKKLEDAGLNGRYLILSNRDDIPNLLNAMDVFVFPSKYEGLGMALVEAQEARLPCFVSDRVPEYATISNLVTRLPLENGAKKWADAIMNYKKPKKVIVDDENWDIKKITKQLEQLYLDALAENQNGKK